MNGAKTVLLNYNRFFSRSDISSLHRQLQVLYNNHSERKINRDGNLSPDMGARN
jgi:hypothetical protein